MRPARGFGLWSVGVVWPLGKSYLGRKQKVKKGGILHSCSQFSIHAANVRQDFMNKICKQGKQAA